MTTRRGRRSHRAVLFALAAGGLLLPAAAGAATMWECTEQGHKYFTNIDPNRPHYLCVSRENPRVRIISPEDGPGCQYRKSQPPGTCRTLTVRAPAVEVKGPPAPRASPLSLFRERLKIGDRTSAGLVIEVRPPIARVQTDRGERWFRIDELYPAP